MLERLVENSAAPVYVLRDNGVQAGVLGGVVLDFHEQGRQAALLARRLLAGAPAATVPVLDASPNRAMFDSRALERFGISESALPPDSIVINRPTDLLHAYFGLTVTVIAVIASLVALVAFLAWLFAARRGAERRLRESEQRFRDMVEGSLQGVLIHRHRVPIFANQALADMLGYESPEEILRLSSTEQVYSPHEHARMRAYQEARRTGSRGAPSEYEFDAVRKDGTTLRLLTVVHGTTWDGGFATQHNVVDITARQRAERALRASETRFRDFAETAADWFWETDADHRFIYLSEPGNRSLAPPPHLVLGRRRDDLYCIDLDGEEKLQRHHQDLEARRPFRDLVYHQRMPDGTIVVRRISGKPFFDADGVFAGYRGTATDVTEAHALSERLSHQSSHDALTGLLNRRAFERRLKGLLDEAPADRAEHVMCHLDLDLFKVINDTCGHVAGDELLRQLGTILLAHVRKTDSIARLGGDEFGILMEHCSLEQAEEVAAKIRGSVEAFRFAWRGQRFNVGVSIGVVALGATMDNVTDALSAADAACYAAKDAGRNRVRVYSGEDTDLSNRHSQVQWVTRIQHSLESDCLGLHYQPIAPLTPGALEGAHYELLLRMADENGEWVPASAFMPAA
jgi:diguanylate cyclase (GGDEF)-like protein/PAS domain S-box-containing protein